MKLTPGKIDIPRLLAQPVGVTDEQNPGGMTMRVLASLVALFSLLASNVDAGQSRTLFQHKNWKVRIEANSDATAICVASVEPTANSWFALRADGTALQLEFYSSNWNLGYTTGDVVARIDQHAGWNLYSANFNGQLVDFTLPRGDGSKSFLLEIAKGNFIYLNQRTGGSMGQWSLAGSMASIVKLNECIGYL